MKPTVSIIYIFCAWIWIISLLFITNITSFAPIFSLLIALIFTTITFLFQHLDLHISKKIGIIGFELLVFISVLTLMLKRKTTTNIKLEVVIFTLYNIFLYINNETFNSIYFDKLIKSHSVKINGKPESLLDYIKRRLYH